MFVHFLNSTIRKFRRQPLFAAINLFGLATAMAVCFIVVLFVYGELSYDRFHDQSDNLFRLSMHLDIQGDIRNEAVTSHAVGPDLLAHFPEVTNMTRVAGWNTPVSIWQDGRYVTTDRSMYAESSFFDVFSYKLLRGNPKTALSEPFSIVITEDFAAELFPDEDPMGNMVRLDNRQDAYVITGIAENCPPNSHLQFNLLRSYPTLRETSSANFYEWDAYINAFTYVVLAAETDMDMLQKKTEALTYEKLNYKFEGQGVHISLQYFPVKDIRLHSPFNHDMVETGTAGKVWIFSVIAVFVLFIAGFNYVNLTIARSGNRAKEVGVRAVLGASKLLLKKQFYVESIFMTAAGFLVSLILVEILLPFFNRVMQTNLQMFGMPWWLILIVAIVFIGLFGFLAGIYPSWHMSRLQPVKILKGEFWQMPGRFQPRNLLLLIQFIVSLALIVCTIVVFLQIRFFNKMDLGFDDQNLVVVMAENHENAQLYKHILSEYVWVTESALTMSFPGGSVYLEGIEAEDIKPGIMTQRIWVDKDFFKTMDISLHDGRFFRADAGPETEFVLINRAFARKAGWSDAIGRSIGREGRTYRIIGVTDDFHMQSLHNEVEPMMINSLGNRPDYTGTAAWVMIRFDEASSTEVLSALQQEWSALFPDKTFNYYFISELISDLYLDDYSFGRLFLAFTLLAILIAMLGVLGLSAFAARQRQKEISIRRVLGAGSGSLVFMLAAEMLKWVLVSAVIALPLAWYFMEQWLAGFAYAINFPFWAMGAALFVMLLMALLIVTIQSSHTIYKNPAEVLITE
jgi:putative ABC transport system permease protein